MKWETRMENRNHVLIPLELAELLYVTLGPLSEVLQDDNHKWAPIVKMVLRAYREGRDDMLGKMYGDRVLEDIDLCTFLVSEQLVKWVSELSGEQTDFDKWAQEMGNGEN